MRLALACLLVLTGCVMSRPYAKETTMNTNGIVFTKELKLTTFAIWPGTQLVDKQRGSIGKTLSLGQSGIEQESNSTNLIEALKVIDSILGKLR